MQRTKRSVMNVAVALFTNVGTLITAFVVQKVLVQTMGEDYNGVNGLFSGIISMMSMADLGIGTAIVYHMYRPVAERDSEKINSLLRFYKYCYLGISAIVLCIGLVVALFLPMLTADAVLHDSIYLIFALFVVDCLCSYFLGYKKSLLYADMANYIPDAIYFGVYMVQNALQIYVLLAFRNFIAFLVVKSMGKVLSNLLISLYIRHKYPFTNTRKVCVLETEVKRDIVIKVKGLLFHKIGKLVITGSDSIVLTGVLGIHAMNLYTNYHLVIGGITALFNKAFETLSNSVGNFLLDSNTERNLDVYKKIDLLNFWLFGTAAAGMYAVLQPFIVLWLGKKFLFSEGILLVLVYNFYMEGMRASVNTFKEAAGIFHEDRFVPIAEAVVNLAASVILANLLGVAGVFMGTIISTGVVYLYSYPKYICKPLFGLPYGKYVGCSAAHLGVLTVALAGVKLVNTVLEQLPALEKFFLAGIASVMISQAVFLLFYGRSREFKFFCGLLKARGVKSRSDGGKS